MTPPLKASARARAAWAAAAAVLVLAGLEYLVRFLPEARTMLVRPSPIPGVAYQLVPDMEACGDFGCVHINKWGFRGPDYPMEKPPGVFRIAALGNSVLFGESAGESATAEALSRRLQAEHPAGFPSRVQAVNTAVPGYELCQELALLEGYADRFAPDLVLVGYVMNGPEGPRVPFGLDIRTGRIPSVYRLYHFLKQRFFLAKYLAAKASPLVFRLRGGFRQFGPAQAPSDIVGYTRDLHDPKGAFWPACASCLWRLGAYRRRRKVPVLLVIFPLLDRLGDARLEAVYRQVEETARAAGLDAVNLHPAFAALPPREAASCAGDGVHLSREGHEFVAGLLHRWLLEHPGRLSGRG
jgi:hypothetical protein